MIFTAALRESINEFYLTGASELQADFTEEAAALKEELLKHFEGKVPVWLKLHVSDIANQYHILRQIFDMPNLFVSIIGQAPALPGAGRIAIEAWLLSEGSVTGNRDQVILNLKNYRHHYFQHELPVEGDSERQMHDAFQAAEEVIGHASGTLENNLQRTWIYCRDIDNRYAGLVKARREFFNTRGLTAETHYIASTGIEGSPHPFNRVVKMDNFALFGHQKGQIQYLQALDHLSPTHVYGVTFERGTRIVYGDRSHSYISGTASIDRDGKVMFEGNVVKQTRRLVENVEALLENGGGSLNDLKLGVVYLRDTSDAVKVAEVLNDLLPSSMGRIIVRGSVCRPTWLVEMEAIAANYQGNPDFAAFA